MTHIPHAIHEHTFRAFRYQHQRMKNGKRFVRYKEGAEMYSMCQSKFEQMAKDAKAIYKVDKLVLVNCDIFEEYLETFRMYV